ncbi:hypothetical protein Tco_0650483 [Tanacetum coccineum]
MSRKRSSGSNFCASQNLAFLSSKNTGGTNEVNVASGDFGVITGGGINQVSSTPFRMDDDWGIGSSMEGGYVDCQSKEVHSKDRKEFGLQRKMTYLEGIKGKDLMVTMALGECTIIELSSQALTTYLRYGHFNTGKGKLYTDFKKSRWVWRTKGNYLDHVSKDNGPFMLEKIEAIHVILLKDHAVWIVVSLAYVSNGKKLFFMEYEDFNGGFVAFGVNPKDELNFKLLNESQVVLRAPRKDDVYSLDLKNIVPSGGNGYHQKDRKPSQNDKTEHGMEKTVQNQGQSPKMPKSESILKNQQSNRMPELKNTIDANLYHI